MTTTAEPLTRVHPIARFAARGREVIGSLVQAPAWSMTPDEQRSALVDLAALEAQVAELRGRVLLAGDRNSVGLVDASPTTTAWFANATLTTRGQASQDLRLAAALDEKYAATRAAFAAGRLVRSQAVEVVAALDGLAAAVKAFEEDREAHPVPGQPAAAVPDDLMVGAERVLLESAETCDANALRACGKHLLALVAPDIADEALGRKLAAQDRAAEAKHWLSISDNGDGTHSGRFTVPDLHAAILAKALDALCSPRTTRPGEPGHHRDAEGRRVPRPEQRGQALCALLERLPAENLPMSGGLTPTVVVTIDWSALTSWYATAGLDTGERISAGEARRLLCNAGVLPAVLDGESEVLDLGRAQRLFSRAQRRALNLTRPTCQTDGCSRPAAWCEAHHLIPWSKGGPTDLAAAANLCPWHHHRAHDPRYDLRRHPDGSMTFHRRT